MRIIDADNFLEKLKHAALDSVPINVERDFRLAMRIIENTIGSQPEVNQWISCSEVLPKEKDTIGRCSDTVQVCGYDEETDYSWLAYGWYSYKSEQWYFAECKTTDKPIDWIDIVAWMPLPEPYKEHSNEA